MKSIQPLRLSVLKCTSARALRSRPCMYMWTSFLAIVLLGFLLSQHFLHVGEPCCGFQVRAPDGDAALLMYSQLNPAVNDEREKIKFLLTESNYGKVSIKDIVYSRAEGTFIEGSNPASRRQKLVELAWMLPLTSKVFNNHTQRFFELSKMWLGEPQFEPGLIMKDLLPTVKKPLDRHVAHLSRAQGTGIEKLLDMSWGRERYESCAVVGNSGILLNGTYGEQIDSNEMVIRLNNAEILPYAKHVGSKTTLSFMNSNVFRYCSNRAECWCHRYGNDVPIVLYVCQARHLMDVAVCGSYHETPLLVTSSLLDALTAAIVKWYSVTNFVQTTGRRVDEWHLLHDNKYFHYSSGMQAVVLALGICDRGDIFGFGKLAGSKHHYHTEQEKELSLHDYEAEYLFYHDLVHSRKLPYLSSVDIAVPPVRIFQ